MGRDVDCFLFCYNSRRERGLFAEIRLLLGPSSWHKYDRGFLR